MTQPQHRYRQRFDAVIDFIHDNLGKPLTLDSLAAKACFSRYHFQRQFCAIYGVSSREYIHQLRMERSAQQLAFRQKMSISDIAFDNQYLSQAAFNRAFKRHFSQSPLQFRKNANWPAIEQIRTSLIKTEQPMGNFTSEQVVISDFKSTPIALLKHVGSPAGIMASVATFITWRKEQPVAHRPPISDTYNIIYDDPLSTPNDEYRFGIACSINGEIARNSCGVLNDAIPGGRCAILRLSGSETDMASGIDYLYRCWLADSDEEPRDFPLFVKRIAMFPDVAPHQQEFEIYLPIK